MWSLGVCLFGLLNGFFPVDEAKSSDWRFNKLCKAQELGKSSVTTILGGTRRRQHLSGNAATLLDALLNINLMKRPIRMCLTAPSSRARRRWTSSTRSCTTVRGMQ